MKISVVSPKERPAKARAKGFSEVVARYTIPQALKEARRCLQCADPRCIPGCPVNIDIKKFIRELKERKYRQAYLTIREKNNFAAICGRVCPAEYQCRKACVLTRPGEPYASDNAISIHFLERFVGDYGIDKKVSIPVKKDPRLAKYKVAVIGSGPAGLCCAGELARRGIKVTVFESLHKPGGVLRYGIPPFRLPQKVLDDEINFLRKAGVTIELNTIVGKAVTISELFAQGFAAIFLGLGAGTPTFLGIPGENLGNIYSANEFLTRVNLMRAYEFPKFHTPINIGEHVIVIGGGNTAMDAARAALRLQHMNKITPDTAIVYRRTEVEMPARRLEIQHAKEEGARIETLLQPLEFIEGDNGLVTELRCLRCALGDPDDSGRRKPVPIRGSEFSVPCDVAIIAVGLRANQVLIRATPALKTDEYGDVIVDKETMETSIPHVYAGGDIVGGEGTVIEAMGMAKKAAASIIRELSRHEA